MQRIKILLPAYNEEQSLPSLLRRIQEVKTDFNLPLEVLVVNDGSTDNTLKVAADYGARVLDLQPNRGLAGAMREGIQEALKNMIDHDILITMDADDSHHPGLIFRMVTQIREGFDLVIASRYRYGSRIVGLAKFREFLSSGARYIFLIFAPIRGVRDYTCGYRAYNVGLLRKLSEHYGDKLIEQKGFACMAEILLKSRRFDPIIMELPFILRYDQKQGASKMRLWRTVKQTFVLAISSR
jgi:dolichol-phosphate mannosyltransferase